MKPRKEDNKVSRSYQMTLGRKKTSRVTSRVSSKQAGETHRHNPTCATRTRYAPKYASLRQPQSRLTHRILFFFSSSDMKKLHDGGQASMTHGDTRVVDTNLCISLWRHHTSRNKKEK